MPQKQPKRGRLWLNDDSCIRSRPQHKGHVWSYDFVQNRTHDGKVFRMLCVIDEYTRECLFDDDQVLPLTEDDIQEVIDASHFDWSQIEPAVFGTLFERGLDPGKRTQLGAHFTNGEKIQQIIQPVVIEPLLSEWAQCLQNIKKILERTKNKDHVEPPKGQRRAFVSNESSTAAMYWMSWEGCLSPTVRQNI